ncbi:hypothetical protein IB234_15070 [Pseudomonas sp. PDM16]|uniref:hypothetical protein n=1 Tax=Pseudomonas sp. PDM16 TaxID=2769292 RepID=UPI00177D83C9|nr:hypothetical protein [Pseudomonas sp. PDM16]MBD9415882.1 hypothetical protein [Pseudomonas sp. PDM16]
MIKFLATSVQMLMDHRNEAQRAVELFLFEIILSTPMRRLWVCAFSPETLPLLNTN